MCVVKGVISSK